MDVTQELSLKQMEGLLLLSMKGYHHLFDRESVASILSQPKEEKEFFSSHRMEKVHTLFKELMEKKGLDNKRAFLEELDAESYEILVRTYFFILENSVLASSNYFH